MALDPELRIHLKGCMDELFDAVPRIVGRPFSDKMAKPDRILTSTERNTEGLPSMLLDWQKGAPLELEVILGNPVREARRKGVELPRLQTMYALLKMAQTRRKEDGKKAKL
jgi:ketopantoate reductase